MKQTGFVIGLSTVLCAGVAFASNSASHQEHVSSPYQDSNAIALGKQLHADYCAACHGENLEGQENWQTPHANGRAKAPPHDAAGHMWHHSDSQNLLITKYGMSEMVGDGYESDMPAFKDALSDEDILAILAFIKAQWPDRMIDKHNQINAGAGH